MDGYTILAIYMSLPRKGGSVHPQATIYNDGRDNAENGEPCENDRRSNGCAQLNAPHRDKEENGKNRLRDQRQNDFKQKRAPPQ